MPDLARPASQFAEFGKLLFSDDRSAKAPAAMYGRLGVAHLDHVRWIARRESRVELLKVIAPALVLDVHGPARMIGLELLVGGGHEIRPAGLCVDLQPHREGVGLGLALDARARGRRSEHERDDNRRHENA